MAIRTPGLPVTVIQVAAHSHLRLLAAATLASHSFRTPGLPVIQVVAHSHPRLLAVATLARHSIRTGGLPIIQVVAPMLPVVLVMLTLTLAFLLPPWPSEAHTSASSHSSYVHSHLTSQSLKRCSLRPSSSCCDPLRVICIFTERGLGRPGA